MATRHLTCCVCGNYAGRWEQHWNRDTGYGVCAPCVKWIQTRRPDQPVSDEEIKELYGVEGKNWGKEPS